MAYHLVYSHICRDQIRSLHPRIKPVVKRRIQELKDNPFTGKALEKKSFPDIAPSKQRGLGSFTRFFKKRMPSRFIMLVTEKIYMKFSRR